MPHPVAFLLACTSTTSNWLYYLLSKEHQSNFDFSCTRFDDGKIFLPVNTSSGDFYLANTWGRRQIHTVDAAVNGVWMCFLQVNAHHLAAASTLSSPSVAEKEKSSCFWEDHCQQIALLTGKSNTCQLWRRVCPKYTRREDAVEALPSSLSFFQRFNYRYDFCA